MPPPERDFELKNLKIRVSDQQSQLAVIITHPWGLLGGNMHNNVVCAAALYFQRLGITTARFDFDGSIGRGHAQVDQLLTVAQNMLDGKFSIDEEIKPTNLLLIGYSYGALIAASATSQLHSICVALVCIAPPFGVQHWLLCFHAKYHMEQAAASPDLPRLFLLGDKDNFTSEKAFTDTIASKFPTQVSTGAVLKGADHFFQRREKDVLDVVGEWILETFPICGGDLHKLKYSDFGAPNAHSRVI
jgi:hypothetical protein